MAALDLKKLALPKMTKEQQQYSVIGAVAVIGGFVAFYLYVLSPLNADIASLTKTRDDKAKTLETAKNLDAQREQFLQRQSRVQQGTSFVALRLPVSGDESDTLSKLVKMTTEGNVYLESYLPISGPSGKSEYEGLVKKTARLQFYGDYRRLGDFIVKLANQDAVAYVEDVILDQKAEGLTQFVTIEATMNLVRYETVVASK